MSSIASWSYTAQATIWRNLGKTESGDPIGYTEPEVILCDYEGAYQGESPTFRHHLAISVLKSSLRTLSGLNMIRHLQAITC